MLNQVHDCLAGPVEPADRLCKLGMLVPEQLDSTVAPVLEERVA
jgi:hypothetical protein